MQGTVQPSRLMSLRQEFFVEDRGWSFPKVPKVAGNTGKHPQVWFEMLAGSFAEALEKVVEPSRDGRNPTHSVFFFLSSSGH